MEEWAPTQTEEETTSSLRDRCRSTGHSRNFYPQPSEKEDDGGTFESARILSGNRSGRAALRREQREQLESNHREK
jgi:hypothetical protein